MALLATCFLFIANALDQYVWVLPIPPVLFTFGPSLQGAVQASSSNMLLLAAASNLLNLKPEKHVVGWDTHIGITSPVHRQDVGYVFDPSAISHSSVFSMITSSMAAMDLPGNLRAAFAVSSQKSSGNCTLMKGRSDVPGAAECGMQQQLSLTPEAVSQLPCVTAWWEIVSS